MAVNFSVDLSSATFSDLAALVEAARVAGVDKRAPVTVEGTTLQLKVEPGSTTVAPAQAPQLGDTAIRSVIDILSGKLEPPRR